MGGQILSIDQYRIAIIKFNSTNQTVFAIDEINRIFSQNYGINV